jgi:hypothetical protein
MQPPEVLYRFHVENFRAVDRSLGQVGRLLRKSVSEGDGRTESVLVRLYALLLGAWAECRLRKLLYERQGYKDVERDAIVTKDTLLDQWVTTVELAFRRHYSVVRAPLSEATLPHSAHARYRALLELLDQDLRPIIELRNRLAHGQWMYLLNNDNTDVSPTYMTAVKRENPLSLQFKKSLMGYVSNVIHDLVVSKPAFERDFDLHYRHIEETRRNLHTRDYSVYRAQMQEKYKRGKAEVPHDAHG